MFVNHPDRIFAAGLQRHHGLIAEADIERQLKLRSVRPDGEAAAPVPRGFAPRTSAADGVL